MQIYVDADACPVVDIVEKIAKKYQIFGDTSVRYQSYTDFRLQRGSGRRSRGRCSGL